VGKTLKVALAGFSIYDWAIQLSDPDAVAAHLKPFRQGAGVFTKFAEIFTIPSLLLGLKGAKTWLERASTTILIAYRVLHIPELLDSCKLYATAAWGFIGRVPVFGTVHSIIGFSSLMTVIALSIRKIRGGNDEIERLKFAKIYWQTAESLLNEELENIKRTSASEAEQKYTDQGLTSDPMELPRAVSSTSDFSGQPSLITSASAPRTQFTGGFDRTAREIFSGREISNAVAKKTIFDISEEQLNILKDSIKKIAENKGRQKHVHDAVKQYCVGKIASNEYDIAAVKIAKQMAWVEIINSVNKVAQMVLATLAFFAFAWGTSVLVPLIAFFGLYAAAFSFGKLYAQEMLKAGQSEPPKPMGAYGEYIAWRAGEDALCAAREKERKGKVEASEASPPAVGPVKKKTPHAIKALDQQLEKVFDQIAPNSFKTKTVDDKFLYTIDVDEVDV
jgi:hypothetical protein